MAQAAILLFGVVGGIVAIPYLRQITPRIPKGALEPM